MTTSKAEEQPDAGGGACSFELWMVANLANGAGYYSFVILLIPAYVTEVTGNAADAGIVMAVIGLAAVVGPALWPTPRGPFGRADPAAESGRLTIEGTVYNHDS